MPSNLVPHRLAFTAFLCCLAAPLWAQTIGTFSWQQQPYCNVITVTITQVGAVYRLEGTDDQCGTPRRASATGMAFLNPNGTVGIGLAVVTNDGGSGGTPLHIDAAISPATLSGTWRDSAGNTGTWAFTPGAGSPGSPRPVPRLSFPGGVSVGGGSVTNVAAPVAATDAANKSYVDTAARSQRSIPVNLSAYSGAVSGNVVPANFGCIELDTAAASVVRLDLPLPEGALLTSIRLRYIHAANASTSMFIGLYSTDFQDSSATDILRQSHTSAPIANGTRVVTLTPSPALPPVSAIRSYYVLVQAASHTGVLMFCGATPFYSLP